MRPRSPHLNLIFDAGHDYWRAKTSTAQNLAPDIAVPLEFDNGQARGTGVKRPMGEGSQVDGTLLIERVVRKQKVSTVSAVEQARLQEFTGYAAICSYGGLLGLG